MTKRPFKIALGTFFFALAMLGSFKIVQARTLINQTSYNGFIVSDCIVSSTAGQCWNSDNSNQLNSSHAFGGFTSPNWLSGTASTSIGSVTLKLKKLSSVTGLYLTYACTNGTVNSTNTIDTDNLSDTGYTDTTFYFTNTTTCDLGGGTNSEVRFFLLNGASRSSVAIAGTDSPIPDYQYFGVGDYTVSVDLSYQPYIIVNDQTGGSGNVNSFNPSITQASTSTPIVWQDPPFSDGFVSSDFNNWQTCVYLYTGASGGSASYYVNFAVGTSTPGDLFTETPYTASSTAPFYTPIYNLPLNECPITAKQNSLSPGNYVAQAGLYRHSNSFGDSFVASTTILNFSVSTGTPVNFPGQIPLTSVSCDFHISNTGVSTVDDVVNGIINGTCKVFSYLFVPQSSDFTQFSSLWDNTKRKPPLGYFLTTSDEFNSLSTSTPASVTVPNLDALGALKTAIDGGFALLVALSFLLFLWRRFRNFDFHL